MHPAEMPSGRKLTLIIERVCRRRRNQERCIAQVQPEKRFVVHPALDLSRPSLTVRE
jgi:hypothetical protein